jgi:hypothetical protein
VAAEVLNNYRNSSHEPFLAVDKKMVIEIALQRLRTILRAILLFIPVAASAKYHNLRKRSRDLELKQ